MSETRFTPGPWNASECFVDCGSGAATQEVCDLHNSPLREAGDNAHLIAAAPELYEALQSMVWGFKELNNNIDCGEEYDAYIKRTKRVFPGLY